MRIRVLFSLVFVSAFVLQANAQFKFGIRAGVNTSNVSLTEFSNSDYALDYKSSPEIGFHFGVVSQLKLASFVIQPELLFTTTKTDLKLTDLTNAASPIDTVGSQKFNKIDIPIIVGYKLGPLKLQVGPVATFMINSKSDLLSGYGIEESYKGMSLGYQAGLGLELTSLLLDVKYEGSLSALGDGITVGGETFAFDQRISQWIISLGFLF